MKIVIAKNNITCVMNLTYLVHDLSNLLTLIRHVNAY